MESQRVPPIQFNLVNESVNFGYNPILNNNNENENIENENNMNTNDNTSDNNNYDPIPPTPPTPSLIDDTSPRTTNLMEQFSKVMSNVADDDDDDDVLNLPLDTEFDDFPRRENIFTPPNQEKNEPLITYEQIEGENELNGDEGIINGEMVENKGNNKIGKKSTKGGNVTINNDEEMNVDEVDFDIWENDYIPPPPTSSVEMPTLITSLYGDNVPIQTLERTKLFEALPDYKENFNQESRPVELVVSKIPEEIVRARHRDIEANEAKLRNDQVMTAKLRERDLLWREHQARTRVENLETKSKTKLNNEVEKIYKSTKEREDLLGRQFRKAKEDMEEFLAKQEAYLQEVHGEVAPTQNLSRKYRVEWGKYPQPIEMRIRNLRACKNKLPKGAYVLLLTQYDQLGGNPLAWSKLGSYGIGSEYPASTKPVKHYGRYFDRVLKIDDSVFALCPPKKQLRPSNVFIIELFHLASRSNPTDHVVAWAALPIINAHFTVVEGKFRLPLIRGETNPTIKHFKSIEELIANDLNAWLCNIYIEIRHLPRSTLFEGSQVTKSEYEIEFDFMSKMLNIKNNEDKRNSDHSDNEDDDFHRALFYKKKAEVDVTMFNRKLHRRKLIKNTDIKDPSKDNNNTTLRDSPRMHMLNAKGGGGASGWWSQALANRRGSKIAVENVPSSVISPITNGTENQTKIPEQIVDISSSDDEDDDKGEPNQILERSYAPGDEFFLHEFQKGKLPGVETLNSKTERQWAAAGIEGGKTIRRHQNDGPRLDSEAVPLQNENRLKKARDVGKDSWTSQLVEQRDYDEYTMSMAPDPGQQRRLLPRALMKSKLRYLYFEALGDLFPSQWGTLESHLATIIFIIAFWLRMYMHYIIQYLFLQIFNIPLYDFQLRIYEIMFKYMANSIPVSVEFGVVAIGPVANLAIFSIFVFMSMMFYKYGGYLPDSVSQFVAAYGVATFFDPLCILIIDIIKHNYNCSEVDDICRTDYTSKDCNCFTGDFVKLWKRMEHDENSGLTGLLMTLIAYTGTAIITALVLYEYMVYVHKNGRILDIWRRVTAPVEEFFIPHDFEISSAELTSIIARASLWRGANGSTRKVTISEYIEKDPYDINFVAMTKHYAIYEHELDGKRMLHRHFLMLSDGAIIEIFDQLSFDFSNQFKSLEKLLNVNSNKTNNHNNKNKPNIFDNFEIIQK